MSIIDIRMDSQEASIICSLAQYTKLPMVRKLQLIMGMREQYQAIGFMIADIDAEFVSDHSPAGYRTAARQIRKWAENNRKGKRK
jgi:hypothetical protein